MTRRDEWPGYLLNTGSRIGRRNRRPCPIFRHVSLENAPIVPFLRDVFVAVGTRLFHDGVSLPSQSGNLGPVLDQRHGHFVEFSANLQPHARIALDVSPPRLGIWELLSQSECLRT